VPQPAEVMWLEGGVAHFERSAADDAVEDALLIGGGAEPLTVQRTPSGMATAGAAEERVEAAAGAGGAASAGSGGGSGAAAPGTSAPAAAAACFSRGLLTRAQEQLSSELSRLQLAIGELLDANLSPAAAGAASEAGGASETSEAGEAGEAAGGLEARVCSLARRLGWARSDLALLRPHVEAH